MLHCLLDKGNVAPRYRVGLRELAGVARADGELAGAAETICPAGCDASKMLKLARRGDWVLLERAAGEPAKGFVAGRPSDRALRLAAALFGVLSSRTVRRYTLVKARSLVSPSARGPRAKPLVGAAGGHRAESRVLKGARRFLRFARRGQRRGLTVALLGPYGVGKTTLAASLAGPFPDFAGVRRLYVGLGYAGLPRMARLPVPGSLAAVGLLTLWWRYLVALYHRGRGRLVIFYRYTYDALLPPGRRLTEPQRLARWVWARACPAPDLDSGKVACVEALAYWKHPERGLVTPAEFIPVAEETGLIVPLGRWALKEACRQAKEWQALRPEEEEPPLTVSVNLSAGQFEHEDLAQDVARALGESGLAATRLILEIAEGDVMEDASRTARTMGKLKALGVDLSIDDFGTGYSNLAYLERFPVDYLEIDRSFVGGLEQDAGYEAIASGMLSLAHAMGLKVVAEGVETEGQLRKLEEMGCGMAQGYLFSEPLPTEAAAELLAAAPPRRWRRQAQD